MELGQARFTRKSHQETPESHETSTAMVEKVIAAYQQGSAWT